jgi:hypothetical protein
MVKFKTLSKRVKRKTKKLTKTIFIPLIKKLVTKKFKNTNTLTFFHFLFWSELNHINREGLTIALNLLQNKPCVIVETGTSAWGTDSTRLWNSYVRSFGGLLFSVDIRATPREKLGDMGPLTQLIVDDSINFLDTFNDYSKNKIDLLYLDSFDIDWQDPLQAMQHGLKEFEVVEKYLKPGSVIVIDDTPVNTSFLPASARDLAAEIIIKYGVCPGKGALVLAFIKSQPEKYKVIYHNYNLVFRILK